MEKVKIRYSHIIPRHFLYHMCFTKFDYEIVLDSGYVIYQRMLLSELVDVYCVSIYEEFIKKNNKNSGLYWPVVEVVSKDDVESKRHLCDKQYK